MERGPSLANLVAGACTGAVIACWPPGSAAQVKPVSPLIDKLLK